MAAAFSLLFSFLQSLFFILAYIFVENLFFRYAFFVLLYVNVFIFYTAVLQLDSQKCSSNKLNLFFLLIQYVFGAKPGISQYLLSLFH